MPKREVAKDARLDRHSGTGVSGDPKKGGLKGWGKVGEYEGATPVLDENDPNYVDENEDTTEPTEEEK